MEFDYVIVGGGSAGCVMAARLSEDPEVSVCLLEAGGKGEDLVIRAPALVAAMISGRPKINNWAFHTEPQPELNGRRGFQPRGKTLGGSSAINAMLYVRGHQSDYDDWANLGWMAGTGRVCCPISARPKAMCMARDESARRGWALAGAGSIGPTGRFPRPLWMRRARCRSARMTISTGSEQEGAGLYQVTQFHKGQARGTRCSASAAYLRNMSQTGRT